MRRISGHLIAVAALVLSCVSNLSGQRVAVAALALIAARGASERAV